MTTDLNYLYHATWHTNLGSIMEHGIQPGSDGCVYLAGPTPAHAGVFVALRQYESDESYLYVIRVPVDELDSAKLRKSYDHNASFFPEDTESFYYTDTIPYDFDWDVYQLELPTD
jgi:hypothetical protein